MADIPIYADVECVDGPCGKSITVIVDRQTREVTHLVVEDKSLPHKPYERLVPVDLVEDSRPELIRLSCTRNDLDRMEAFIHTHYAPREQEDYTLYEGGEGPGGVGMWGRPSTVGQVTTKVEEEQVLEGELAIHPNTHVQATDGRVGIVEDLIVDPDTGRVTHFILQEGHLWGKKDVTIPLSAVDHVEGDTVYLNLDKAAAEKLPSVRSRRH